MYNLFVSADKEQWKLRNFMIERSRAIKRTEYTDEDVSKQFATLDDETLKKLRSYPCLFAVEEVHNKDARIGWLTKIKVLNDKIRIEYELVDTKQRITAARISKLKADLHIADKYEMNRTHWAVKDVDLLALLENEEIIDSEQNEQLRTRKVEESLDSEDKKIIDEAMRITDQHIKNDLEKDLQIYIKRYRDNPTKHNATMLSLLSTMEKTQKSFINVLKPINLPKFEELSKTFPIIDKKIIDSIKTLNVPEETIRIIENINKLKLNPETMEAFEKLKEILNQTIVPVIKKGERQEVKIPVGSYEVAKNTFVIVGENEVDTHKHIQSINFKFDISDELGIKKEAKDEVRHIFKLSENSYHALLCQASLFYYTLALEIVVRSKLESPKSQEFLRDKTKSKRIEDLTLGQILTDEICEKIFLKFKKNKSLVSTVKNIRNANIHFFDKDLQYHSVVTEIGKIQKLLKSIKGKNSLVDLENKIEN